MTDSIVTQRQQLGNSVVKQLNRNGFEAEYVATAAQARERVLSLIPDGAEVGFGGSRTIVDLDLKPTLTQKGCVLLDHFEPGLSPEQKMEMRRRQLVCDVFLASSNAVTLDGRLYNVDGTGNRVAAMVFGPRRTVLVVGINKIVRDLEAADARMQTVAAPLNTCRLQRKTPCVETGYCMDCKSPDRICNAAVVLHRCPSASQIRLLIVGEELGF